MNIFQTFIFVHIPHYREDTYLLSGLCYFDDLIWGGGGETRRGHKWKHMGTSITTKNVELKNLNKKYDIYFNIIYFLKVKTGMYRFFPRGTHSKPNTRV